MLISVMTKNMGMQAPEPMLMLAQGTQPFNAKEEDERGVLVPIEEGGANLSQTLDNLNPSKMDKKKVGYVTRGSKNKKAYNNKTHIPKKKGCSLGRNTKSVDVRIAKEREANGELIKHEQKDPPKDKDVFASINTFVLNTSIAFSSRPNVTALDEDDNKKASEELWHTDLLVVPLNLYSFVCQI